MIKKGNGHDDLPGLAKANAKSDVGDVDLITGVTSVK
jgi:hypothetical protein